MLTTEGLSAELTDLRECNREAIHLFAAIQARGCVLLFTPRDLRIQCASENVQDIIGSSHRDVIGAKLDHVLPTALVKCVRDRIDSYPWPRTKGRYFQVEEQDQFFDGYIYETEGLFGLEVEINPRAKLESTEELRHVTEVIRDFHSELKSCKSVEDVAQLSCRAVRELTGLDRVMLYRFLYPSWHGHVIGEDRSVEVHSYMNHRFPASDIPQPARDLYLKNPTRIISDVNQEDSRILPPINPLTGKTIDLSHSRLRAVSKVHLAYLRNMGVKASLSFAVTVKGELWGLIACHALKTFQISQSQRNACELIAEACAAQAPLLESLASFRAKATFDTRLKRTIDAVRATSDPVSQLFSSEQVMDIFESSGVALVARDKIDFVGLTPRPVGLRELAGRLLHEAQMPLATTMAIENLHRRFENLQNVDRAVSGVLVTRLQNDSLLMLFRPEAIKTITWGGDPVKQLDRKGFQGMINPRQSFEAWQEVIRDQSSPWQPFEVDGLQHLAEQIQ